MLPRNRRINKDLFPGALRKSSLISGSTVYLRVHKTGKSEIPSQMSVIISSKTVKLAVKRNLIKRRCHSILESKINLIKGGYLLFFFVTKDISCLKMVELENIILDLLEQAGLIIKQSASK